MSLSSLTHYGCNIMSVSGLVSGHRSGNFMVILHKQTHTLTLYVVETRLEFHRPAEWWGSWLLSGGLCLCVSLYCLVSVWICRWSKSITHVLWTILALNMPGLSDSDKPITGDYLRLSAQSDLLLVCCFQSVAVKELLPKRLIKSQRWVTTNDFKSCLKWFFLRFLAPRTKCVF